MAHHHHKHREHERRESAEQEYDEHARETLNKHQQNKKVKSVSVWTVHH